MLTTELQTLLGDVLEGHFPIKRSLHMLWASKRTVV